MYYWFVLAILFRNSSGICRYSIPQGGFVGFPRQKSRNFVIRTIACCPDTSFAMVLWHPKCFRMTIYSLGDSTLEAMRRRIGRREVYRRTHGNELICASPVVLYRHYKKQNTIANVRISFDNSVCIRKSSNDTE